MALLYKENRDEHRIFSLRGFTWIISKGIIISVIIYLYCGFPEILNIKGSISSIWYLSLKSYICVLFVVTISLLIKNNFIVYILPLSIGITTFLSFIIFLILNHYGFLFQFNSKASIFPSFSSPLLYLSVIFVSCFSFVFDYGFKMVDLLTNKSLSSKLLLNERIKRKSKSSLGICKVHSSKPYPKIYTRKRKSVQISRNFLLYKMPIFLIQIMVKIVKMKIHHRNKEVFIDFNLQK